MKRTKLYFALVLSLLVLQLILGIALLGQETAPTLVPPTLVPTQNPAVSDILISESTIARLQRDGKVRIGMLYNAAPFGELNIRGEVSGFDADLAKKMAETWGIQVEFVQVTRQTAIDMLKTGQVDLLLAAQIHQRELDSQVEFSQTYYYGSQSMMLRADDSATTLTDMASRRIGYVIGTDGERAAQDWGQRSSNGATLQTYLTLDQAYVALVSNEVDGVIDSRVRLLRAATQPDLIRILDETVSPEPYAVVMLRQDVNMRNLVNRTLQYLVQDGSLEEIHQAHFSGSSYPTGTIPLWTNIGEDAPIPGQFAADITYPAQYAMPRVMSNKVLRVSGVATLPEDATESQRRMELLNRTLIERMAQKWGVTVEYVPESTTNALDLVVNGQADIAVGVQPDWTWTDRVDFTGSYLLHGERLMIQANSNIQGFIDLRGGKWVAIANNESGVRDRVIALADSVNVLVNIYETREQDIAFSILSEDNAEVAFGDSLKLIPHVQANPNDLKLTKRQPDIWYNRSYVSFAVPRNDIDFRLLVEYTLQELIRDGTLDSLLQPVMMPDEIPNFEIWPGSSDYLGLSLES